MTYDPNGIVGRWSHAPRRGTPITVACAMAVLTLAAFLAEAAIG